MNKSKIIKSLHEISNFYNAYIIDIWGVLWDGIEAYEYAKETLEQLKKNKNHIILLSNAPRRTQIVEKRLQSIGIYSSLYDTIVSSGEVCRECFLDDHKKLSKIGYSYYFIGQDTDKGITSNLKIREQKNMKNANFLLVCGTRDFDHTLDDYKKELNQALALNLPFICTNPDKIVVRKEGKLIICAGILAEYYKKHGGRVVYFGKPYEDVYKKSLNFFNSLDDSINTSNILVIGDSLETDILGANSNGLKSLLIADGIHKKQLYEKKKLSLNLLTNLSNNFGIFPDYLIKSFIF